MHQFTRSIMHNSAKSIQTEQEFKGHYRMGGFMFFKPQPPIVRVQFIMGLAVALFIFLTF